MVGSNHVTIVNCHDILWIIMGVALNGPAKKQNEDDWGRKLRGENSSERNYNWLETESLIIYTALSDELLAALFSRSTVENDHNSQVNVTAWLGVTPLLEPSIKTWPYPGDFVFRYLGRKDFCSLWKSIDQCILQLDGCHWKYYAPLAVRRKADYFPATFRPLFDCSDRCCGVSSAVWTA